MTRMMIEFTVGSHAVFNDLWSAIRVSIKAAKAEYYARNMIVLLLVTYMNNMIIKISTPHLKEIPMEIVRWWCEIH